MSGYDRVDQHDEEDHDGIALTDVRVDSADATAADVEPVSSLTGATESATPMEYPPGTLNVVVKTLTGQAFPICLTGHTPMVDDLKSQLEQSQGFPPVQQRLIFCGRELQDGNLLASYNIKENGTTVHLVLRRQDTQHYDENHSGAAENAADGGVNMAAQFPQFNFNPGQGAFNGNPNVDYQRVHEVARLSAAVKIFAMIDGMFVLFLSFSYAILPLFLCVLLCYAGYYGAQRLNHRYVAAYLLYILISIGVRIYLVYNAGNGFAVIFLLGILIEMFIFRLAARFAKLVSELTLEERNELSAMMHNPALQGGMLPRA